MTAILEAWEWIGVLVIFMGLVFWTISAAQQADEMRRFDRRQK